SDSIRRRKSRARIHIRMLVSDTASFFGEEHEIQRVRKTAPIGLLGLEDARARRRQSIILGVAIVLGCSPFTCDEALALEAIECGIQRSLADLERIARELLDALADSPAVQWRERERFENQQVQRAFQNIGGGGHGLSCRTNQGVYDSPVELTRVACRLTVL